MKQLKNRVKGDPMKASNIKQHNTKANQVHMDIQEDKWGDNKYHVEGVQYDTELEAKKAIHDLITAEFNSRNKKG